MLVGLTISWRSSGVGSCFWDLHLLMQNFMPSSVVEFITRTSAYCFVMTCGRTILNKGLCALCSLLLGIGFRRTVEFTEELNGAEELMLPWFWLGFLS